MNRTAPCRRIAVVAALACGVLAASATHAWAAEPLRLPEVQERTLPNGLRVVVSANASIPYAAVRFATKAGALLDPEGQEGLASATASLLLYGTQTRSADAIRDEIDRLGASLHASAGRRSSEVAGDCVTIDPEAFKRYLDLFADVVRHPTFPAEEVARVRTRLIGALDNEKDDNRAVANRAFDLLLYKGHPYGRPVDGTPRSLGALTSEAARAFHARYWLPDHAVLGVAGDVDPEAIFAWAEAAFGDEAWGARCPADRPGCGERICVAADEPFACAAFRPVDPGATGDAVNPVYAPAPPVTGAPESGLRIVVIDKDDPGINQVQWRLGRGGAIGYDDADWAAFRLGAHLLGGDFTGRLNQTLRVREGLTYGARLLVEHARRLPGSVAVWTYVAPGNVPRAVELAIAELAGAAAAPPSDAELASFKAKIIEALPFRFETPADIVEQVLNLYVTDLTPAFLEQYPVVIDAVTGPALQAAVTRGAPSDGLLLVAVGNADLAGPLEALVEGRGGSIEVIPVAELYR